MEKEKKILFISVSQNPEKLIEKFLKNNKEKNNFELINLNQKNIEFIDLKEKYSKNDEFYLIAKKIFKNDLIVFLSPIYYYAMPARLKNFFDRFNSIYVKGDLNKLENKNTCLIFTYGADSKENEIFEKPFEYTFKYLKMKYLGSCPIKSSYSKGIEEKEFEKLIKFAKNICKNL